MKENVYGAGLNGDLELKVDPYLVLDAIQMRGIDQPDKEKINCQTNKYDTKSPVQLLCETR